MQLQLLLACCAALLAHAALQLLEKRRLKKELAKAEVGKRWQAPALPSAAWARRRGQTLLLLLPPPLSPLLLYAVLLQCAANSQDDVRFIAGERRSERAGRTKAEVRPPPAPPALHYTADSAAQLHCGILQCLLPAVSQTSSDPFMP